VSSAFATWRRCASAPYPSSSWLTSFGSTSNGKQSHVPIIKVEMEDFQKEDWVSIYQSGLTELEHARISGRIEAAEKAIVSRMEKLLTMPGLHSEERHAIEDAIPILGILEREEARYDAERKRFAVGSLLEKLRSVGCTIVCPEEG
jgi:hypothetical protein